MSELPDDYVRPLVAPRYDTADYCRAHTLSGYPEQVRAIAREFAKDRARITELLDANNRFEQRARLAERELEAINGQFAATARMLADVGRERDELKAKVTLLQGELDCAETEIEELQDRDAS